MNSKKIEQNIVKNAGKFLVITKLLEMGFIVTLKTNKYGHKQLLFSRSSLSNLDSSKELLIDTSCYQNVLNSKEFGKAYTWMLKDYHEKKIDPKLFYCFVFFDYKSRKYRFFIVPSNVVAEYISITHRTWLDGKITRRDKDLRVFRIGFKEEQYNHKMPLTGQYENSWDTLQ